MTKYSGSDAPTVRESSPVHGAGLQLLVISERGDYLGCHPLPDRGRVEIGRAEDSDVRIDDASISRNHAALHTGPRLFVEDQGSSNGSRVRGQPVPPGRRIEVAIGEAIMLGKTTAIVQRRVQLDRTWRLWGHSYFEGRLEDECARAERYDESFALIHALFASDVSRAVALAAIESITRPGDVVGDYGPGQYEVLVVAAEQSDAEAIAEQLSCVASSPQVGVACFPAEGRDPHSLLELARRRARGIADEPSGSDIVITGDDRMRELRAMAARVAAADISVLILGETGVGKEVFAQSIHDHSPRADKPLFALNCGALTESLLESELFGHKRGAFTGAYADKPGLLESASGGTVFLDEIGELPPRLQVALLRVLEEREVRRVGELQSRPIDVRFVCATNRDLEAEVARGAFRGDLYWRINAVSLMIPPLRERPSELLPLVRHFVGRFCASAHRFPEPQISPEAMRLLEGYRWPGNIRELRNVIERAVLLCTGDAIRPDHLSLGQISSTLIVPPDASPPGAAPSRTFSPEEQREIEDIRRALDQAVGNQTQAAKLLGISRRTLINRLDRYGLPRPRKGR